MEIKFDINALHHYDVGQSCSFVVTNECIQGFLLCLSRPKLVNVCFHNELTVLSCKSNSFSYDRFFTRKWPIKKTCTTECEIPSFFLPFSESFPCV